MVWGFSCNRQRENGARYSHLIFNVRKINHCSKNTKHLKITGRLPQEPLQVYMMVFWKGCTKQEQRAQINRNMTILKKKKKRKRKWLLLYVPNRETMISWALYFWHTCRHTHCSEIPSNITLTQLQEAYKDESWRHESVEGSGINSSWGGDVQLYQHWTSTQQLLRRNAMLVLRPHSGEVTQDRGQSGFLSSAFQPALLN